MSSETTTPLGEKIKEAQAKIEEGDFESAIALLTEARKEGSADAEPDVLEDLHYCIGLCANAMQKPADALPHLRKALRLAEESGDQSGQARTLEQLATTAYKRNEHRTSQAFYEKALVIWKKLEDKEGQARCLRDIGSIQSDLMQDKESEESFDKAKVLFKELEDEDGVLACITNVGLLRYRQGGPEGAIELYQQAYDENEVDHYLLHNNMGFLHLVTQKVDKAKEFLLRGREDLEKRKAEDDNAALLHLNLGLAEALGESYEAALPEFEKAEEMFRQFPEGRAVEIVLCANKEHADKDFDPFLLIEDAHKEGITKLSRAAVLQNMGKSDEAMALALEGLEFDRDLAYPHYCLGWLHLARQEQEEASRCFKRAAGKEPNEELFSRALDLVNPYLNTKVGRNDPCPCGSGKKFKKCHGKS